MRSPWLVWSTRELRLFRMVVMIAVGAFVIGYLASSLWMWAGRSGREVVTVPQLRTLSLEAARRATQEAELVLDATDSLPHPRVPVGHVLTQSPLPGREVAPGTPVQVIVSSGRERHAVPQVAGLSRARAEELLSATGLQAVVEEVTDQRRAGLAVGTDPPAGSVVAVPERIRLRISAGPPLVAVPELVGMQEADLPALLAPAQLRLGELTRELRIFESEGQVVAQRPEAGDSVPAGSAVDVVVATQRLELLREQEIR